MSIGSSHSADPSSGAECHGEAAGELIDRFKLIEKLGEGGMGSVWMAQQSEPVKRRVALKIIKLGMDTRDVVARFAVERQALALMDHPHIAKVLDAGSTTSGRPYFVMELVRGVPITEYCDTAKLSLRDRLGLFSKVCHAIQHAHHKGIIHRDVKPSNILVSLQDGVPLPKVIDFGIAKATSADLTNQTLYTQLGQVIGTPEYMAPEQAESGGLDIDTRADIYALGVLLYELLTGTKPFDIRVAITSGFEEVLRVIREVDPAKPSTRIDSLGDTATDIAVRRRVETAALGKRLRGDLDSIVMKALEKDRTRRYGTANGFAEDIQRYLNDEVVEAAPPSARYRIGKLLRRRKKIVFSVAAIVFLLIAGSVGTGIGWWKTMQAKGSLQQALDQKQKALVQEEEQRQLAEENEGRARRAEARALAEAERASQAEANSRERASELEQVAAFQVEQLSKLDVGLMGSRLRAALLDAAPQVYRSELDLSLTAVNFTSLSLETLRDNLFDRTIEAIDEQFSLQPLVQAQLLQSAANTWSRLGLLDIALDPQKRALSIRRGNLGNENPDTLSSIDSLGSLLYDMGELDEAEALYREALRVSRVVRGDEHASTLTVISNLGTLLQARGRYEEAELLLREALGACRKTLGPEHPDTLSSLNSIAGLMYLQGKLPEAESLFREVLEVRRRVLGNEHPQTLNAISSVGALLYVQGQLSEAEVFSREALDIRRRTLGDSHPRTLVSINNMGGLLNSQGKPSQAEPFYREALQSRRRVLGDAHPQTLLSMANLGGLMIGMGQLEEARALYREAVEGSRRVLGEEHPETQISIEQFEVLLRSLMDSSRESGTRLEQGKALAELGSLLLLKAQHVEAESLLSEALDLLSSELPDGDPQPWRTQLRLAQAIAAQARFLEAAPALEEASEWLLQHGKAQSAAILGHTPMTLGDVMQTLIDFEEAWSKAEPNGGHASKAVLWHSRLDAWNANRKAMAKQ